MFSNVTVNVVAISDPKKHGMETDLPTVCGEVGGELGEAAGEYVGGRLGDAALGGEVGQTLGHAAGEWVGDHI